MRTEDVTPVPLDPDVSIARQHVDHRSECAAFDPAWRHAVTKTAYACTCDYAQRLSAMALAFGAVRKKEREAVSFVQNGLLWQCTNGHLYRVLYGEVGGTCPVCRETVGLRDALHREAEGRVADVKALSDNVEYFRAGLQHLDEVLAARENVRTPIMLATIRLQITEILTGKCRCASPLDAPATPRKAVVQLDRLESLVATIADSAEEARKVLQEARTLVDPPDLGPRY